MQQLVVTGAGGYIGAVLVPRLLAEGWRVRAVDRFFFGEAVLSRHPDLELVREDCRRLDAALLRGMDAVIDLAAISDAASAALFQAATWEINWQARLRTASLAKQAGVRRYLLASSCDLYAWPDDGRPADETAPVDPPTLYAQADHKVERGVLALADAGYDVVVLRQAAAYGLSPRMRFDLPLNAMTCEAWTTGRLAPPDDGRWCPSVHVRDVADAVCFLLRADTEAVNGQVFNVGSENGDDRLSALAGIVARTLGREVGIEVRIGVGIERGAGRAPPSGPVAFGKLSRLGWRARRTVEEGVAEIAAALEAGTVERTPSTVNREWYQELIRWHGLVREVEMYDGMLDLDVGPQAAPPPDWERVAGEADKLMAKLRRRAL